MTKILGLDLGTNSIGWAVTEQNDELFTLLDKGVDIFQEGVNRTKSGEEPMVKIRTDARALRRHYYRRRLRKIELLKVLVAYDFCPYISPDELDAWRYKKSYPRNEELFVWQRTDEKIDKNPYNARYIALTEVLDLSQRADRHLLGRALYHLAQRRGFLSNRKDGGSDDDGKVKGAIKELDRHMEAEGCTYLGEFYYKLFLSGKKIRTGDGFGYAGRIAHYEKEFGAICDKQNLSAELRKALHRAIFFQRPLKSQKGLVGNCSFERSKARCPISHPRFEEFRMRSFINNIRIKGPNDPELRVLSAEEIELITPLFFRKSKEHFDFEEIAKKLAGGRKGNYGHLSDRADIAYRFNYKMSQTVTGCPMNAALRGIFGDDWLPTMCSLYLKGEGKSEEQILNDVWHVLFSFTDDDKIKEWAQNNLQLDEEQAGAFAAIHPKQGYASLSLCAINKIMPWLYVGYRYDQAAFLANLPIVAKYVWDDEEKREAVIEVVCDILDDFEYSPQMYRNTTKMQTIADALLNKYGIDYNTSARLYEPSRIETYAKAQPNSDGQILLGSPRTSSVRNPMAMRSLFRLRALINKLLKDGKIDRHTKINIEFARGLNDSNMRAAIERYQRDNEKKRAMYADEIRKQYKAETGLDIEPSEDDILKYQLWDEQNHICLYTGARIGISGFIGASPKFDIEHTVPRSRGGDNSQMNKTLCDSDFNRRIKLGKLPAELANHSEVMARIETLGWEKEIESLDKRIEGCSRSAKSAATKAARDKAISDRHFYRMRLNYLRGKLSRFQMIEVPEGFCNRQGVDIGIIGKYAKMYLETVFERVYTVKGATTADFRKMWGLQEEYVKKERKNHVHHCIDAITIACIDSGTYAKWAQFQRDTERYYWHKDQRPVVDKPWPTFTEDVKAVERELIVSHNTANNLPKHSCKKLRVRGKVQKNSANEVKYVQGDTARGALHQQTFYGAIMRDDEIKYVVRKSLGSLQQSDVEKIVDEAVRDCVKAAIAQEGFKEAISKPICFNVEKDVWIKKVRIYASSVTNPIHLKKHRDESRFEYKRDYHVANDSNYCMAIYEGEVKGKTKRAFELVNTLDAVKYFNGKGSADELVSPQHDGLPLKCILRTGTMVLFYENTAAEFYECTKEDLVKRLYKVAGFSTLTVGNNIYGRFTFKHHQEARQAGELKAKNGVWKIGEEYRPVIALIHTQFNALVEGYDFELTVTGEIRFKHNF